MPERIIRPGVAALGPPSAFEARRPSFAGSLLRVFVRRPTDSIGILAAIALVVATLVNALLLQAGPHPAPLVTPAVLPAAKETTGSLAALPRPRPAETAVGEQQEAAAKRNRTELITEIQRELARKGFYEGAIDGIYGPLMDAAIREFEQAAGLRSSGEPAEPLLKALKRSAVKAERPKAAAPGAAKRADAPSPAASRRVTAVQRALTEFGYGQLKLTGVLDDPTKAAVEKFERERKLPVTGRLSERLLRELAAVTGRPLE